MSASLPSEAGCRIGIDDVLEIGRQRRPSPYDFQADMPPVVVPVLGGAAPSPNRRRPPA